MPKDAAETAETKDTQKQAEFEIATPPKITIRFLKKGHPDHDPEFDQHWDGIYV